MCIFVFVCPVYENYFKILHINTSLPLSVDELSNAHGKTYINFIIILWLERNYTVKYFQLYSLCSTTYLMSNMSSYIRPCFY